MLVLTPPPPPPRKNFPPGEQPIVQDLLIIIFPAPKFVQFYVFSAQPPVRYIE
jgi:hypothetical protein